MKENIVWNTVIFFYKHNKEYFLHCIVIFVCMILLTQVISPQVREWFSVIRNEEEATKNRIGILQRNHDFLSRINEAEFNRQFQTASSALPAEKDFVGILNAIGLASAKSGIKVNDFGFYIGDLSGKPVQSLLPSLNVLLNVNGKVEEIKLFIAELTKIMPISDVATINIEEKKSNLAVVFYYRPVSPITFNYTSPLKPLSSAEKSTFEKISLWTVGSSLELVPLSSPSASF